MGTDKIIMDYAMKNDKKEEVFHSSAHAQVQSGAGLASGGVAGIDVAKREALAEQRKLVKGYGDSKLMQGVHGDKRAKKFVPRVETENNSALVGRASDPGYREQVAKGGERSAVGLRGGTPRGEQVVARGGERNR